MTNRSTPVPRRRAFPDITDDFALDELIYDEADVDPPYLEMSAPEPEHDPDNLLPGYPSQDAPPPSPLDLPEP
ncbi:MAG: hypothetical protein ACYC6V_00570 [Bacillota bacterium]